MGADVEAALTRAWMITVEWVFRYYHDGMDSVSQSWQYVPHFAPTLITMGRDMGDLSSIPSTTMIRGIATQNTLPLRPIQALGAVLPSWLWNIVPDPSVREKLYTNRQYYPLGFENLQPIDEPIIPAIPYSLVSTF